MGADRSDQASRPNSSRNCLRRGGRLRPARLMYRFSIDIADRNGFDLRRSLTSAECFKDRAISSAVGLARALE